MLCNLEHETCDEETKLCPTICEGETKGKIQHEEGSKNLDMRWGWVLHYTSFTMKYVAKRPIFDQPYLKEHKKGRFCVKRQRKSKGEFRTRLGAQMQSRKNEFGGQSFLPWSWCFRRWWKEENIGGRTSLQEKFPLFVLSNQGPQWNYQLPWTLSWILVHHGNVSYQRSTPLYKLFLYVQVLVYIQCILFYVVSLWADNFNL